MSFRVSIAGKEELSVPRDRDLILERFQREFRQRDFRNAVWSLGVVFQEEISPLAETQAFTFANYLQNVVIPGI